MFLIIEVVGYLFLCHLSAMVCHERQIFVMQEEYVPWEALCHRRQCVSRKVSLFPMEANVFAAEVCPKGKYGS